MKSFMQIALASFGVLALMLAGCNTDSTTDDTTTDGDTVEEEDTSSMDTVEEGSETTDADDMEEAK